MWSCSSEPVIRQFSPVSSPCDSLAVFPLLPLSAAFLITSPVHRLAFFFLFVSCSCEVPSNKHSARRNLQSRPPLTLTSRRWWTLHCHPPPSCLTMAPRPQATCSGTRTPTHCVYKLNICMWHKTTKLLKLHYVNAPNCIALCAYTDCQSVWTARPRRWCSCAVSSERRRWN